jgi:antitoxin component of RelBE/YafQ-DinJ toxin-antitoxin module
MKVNLIVRIEDIAKKEFYTTCKSLGISPMRTCLILIRNFARGRIDALPIIKEYKEFKANDMNDRVVRMTKYRIDGNEAYKLNKERNK